MTYSEVSGIEIVKRIDSILRERCETRVDLCKALDLKKTMITQWSIRDSVPKVDDCFRISDYLGVSIEWLVYGLEERKEDSLSIKCHKLNFQNKVTVETIVDSLLAKQ